MIALEYTPGLDSPEAILKRYARMKVQIEQSYSRSRLEVISRLEFWYGYFTAGQFIPEHLRYKG